MMGIDLSTLNQYTVNDDTNRILLLETYESSPCETNSKNANVYKVKVIDTSDTIYVLEVCQRMIWVANSKLDAESRYPFIIEPSLKNITEVLIPGNVRIPLGQDSYLVVLNVLSTKNPASYAWPCVPLEDQTKPGA